MLAAVRVVVRARVAGGAGCSGWFPINAPGLSRQLGAHYQIRDGLFPWIRGFHSLEAGGGGGDDGGVSDGRRGGHGGGSGNGGGGSGGRHGHGRAIALMNAGGGALGRGALTWWHPAAPPPPQPSLALGHGFASLSGDICNDGGDGGDRDDDGQQPSRLEEPFSSKHSPDATEHHSPSTQPPTNAQLWALTSAQTTVPLKALGQPASGNEPVLIGRPATAYGHRADEEPEAGAYTHPLFSST
jgi:hypothetical protein